jgi:hypothetical protein
MDVLARFILAGLSRLARNPRLSSQRLVRLGDDVGSAPSELDVVRLVVPVRGWPAGSEGTLIEAFDHEGILEIDGDTVLVPYTAMHVVWSPEYEHAL